MLRVNLNKINNPSIGYTQLILILHIYLESDLLYIPIKKVISSFDFGCCNSFNIRTIKLGKITDFRFFIFNYRIYYILVGINFFRYNKMIIYVSICFPF